MNAKQIILAALDRRKPPRPAASLLSAGCWTLIHHGHTLEEVLDKPQLVVDAICRTHDEIHSDTLWVGSGFHNLAIEALGGSLKFRDRGTPDVRAPIIRNPEDVSGLSLSTIDASPRIENLVSATGQVNSRIGSEALVGSSQWGPFTLSGLILGVENLMRAIYRQPDKLPQLLEFSSELCVRYLLRFIQNGAQIVSVAEPTASGDLISAKQFQQFVLPYLKQVVAQLHAAGARVCLHICGDISDLLPILPESGVDLLSFDYKVDLTHARILLAGKLAFAGNINPVSLLQGTPQQVKELAEGALAIAGDTPGYVLMPGCDIPPAVPVENVLALLQTARRWAGSAREVAHVV